MDPELRRELDEIRALVKDNHQMLRAIRRDQWLGFIGKVIFWAILFVAPFYLYQHYVQPIMEKLSASPAAASSTLFGLPVPTSAELQNLLNSYKTGQ